MKRTWLLFAQAVTVLLAAYFVVATLKPEWLNRRTSLAGVVSVIESPGSAAPATAAPGSLSSAAKKAARVRKKGSGRREDPGPDPADEAP